MPGNEDEESAIISEAASPGKLPSDREMNLGVGLAVRYVIYNDYRDSAAGRAEYLLFACIEKAAKKNVATINWRTGMRLRRLHSGSNLQSTGCST
jgi:hypothetical protein